MTNPQYQQALALHAAGDHQRARPLLLACVQRDPADLELLAAFGLTLVQLGQAVQFEHHARRAIAALASRPALAARAWTLLGVAMLNQRRGQEALDCHRRGCELAPTDPDRVRELGNCANLVGEYALAAEVARRGLELRPDDADFLFRAAANTQLLGRVEEAEAMFAAALVRHPQDPALTEALAQSSNYVPGLDPALVRARHDRFGDLLEAMVTGAKLQLNPAARVVPAGAPLRVGLISPDLRRHSVAWFVEPLLKHHDARAIELAVYSTVGFEDEHSARLYSLLPVLGDGSRRWRRAGRSAPVAVARQIADDGIDVLIDLAGLTEQNPSLVMAQRPAPVQITYLGYPAASGLPGVGWRIVDSITDPPPPHGAQSWSRQTLLRLDPCFLCWTPPTSPSPSTAAPVAAGASGRPVTFASTNALMKVNDRLLSLWGRVLAASPGSRLVVKARGLERASTAGDLRGRMVAAGIDVARCELRGGDVDHAAHLRAYADIDVLLDTWPYHGTTTTLEALWMGVPVVTLVGEAHASRVGLSLLTAVGLESLAATDERGYVKTAVALGADAPRRARLRAELPGRVAASAVCDGPGFCRRFEALLRSVFDGLARG